MEPVPKKSSGCWIYDRHHEGDLTRRGTAYDQFAGEDLLAHGLIGTVDPADYLLDGGKANLPGGLFEGGNAHACQLGPLQLVKAQQTDVAAPVQANALQRTGDL
ncbi:hypothetical protein D3C76_1626190 [compost metagenome]